MTAMEQREIIVPHDPTRGPLVAVRRMLVHSSIAGLKGAGHYERYCSVIAAQDLEQIDALIGPGWLPLDLTLAHYHACDRLGLSDEQIYASGVRAGEAMGDALLVAKAQIRSTTEGSAWATINAFSRMGRRIYDGGSAQYVKLGANSLLIQHRGNPLFSIHYYRVAHEGFMHRTFSAVGLHITELRFSVYRSQEAEIDTRITWR
jgi:hypothetical protein